MLDQTPEVPYIDSGPKPMTNPLADFDFSTLASPTFREDAVREEIIAPVLKALGYRPAGRFSVQRGKSLAVPFVMLGSTKRTVRLIPDYALYVDDRAVLVLDAKAPSEDVLDLAHLGQTYSYAIHPEIRCDHYAVCNGLRLVVFETCSWTAEADIDLTSLTDESWADVVSTLSPETLLPPVEDDYTAWFALLGMILSPNTPVATAASAIYRVSWYIPSVDASREAAAQSAMANLSDTELITVLKAAAHLSEEGDGSSAEHAGYLLSYDLGIAARLRSMLAAGRLPQECSWIAAELADFIDTHE